MPIEKEFFGTTADGIAVERYTLVNASGIRASILTYGGVLQSLRTPDRSGALTDVVLGYDTVKEYETSGGYLGASIGRCGNRIGGASFTLDGREYPLYANDRGNHLHGGKKGFNAHVWDAAVEDGALVLSRVSPDGEEGYPGTLRVSVRHTLGDDGVFTWEYRATTDKATVCNLTNHAYFNLHGQGEGTVLDQWLQIKAARYTDTDDKLIPTGEEIPVAGTPMDFNEPHTIGERIRADYPALAKGGGYDHNYLLEGEPGTLRSVAAAWSGRTGIRMDVKTTMPGIQLYTGNFLEAQGKNGTRYSRYGGFCLETQYAPDAVHHPAFRQPVLRPGEEFHHVTSLKLSVQG